MPSKTPLKHRRPLKRRKATKERKTVDVLVDVDGVILDKPGNRQWLT